MSCSSRTNIRVQRLRNSLLAVPTARRQFSTGVPQNNNCKIVGRQCAGGGGGAVYSRRET